MLCIRKESFKGIIDVFEIEENRTVFSWIVGPQMSRPSLSTLQISDVDKDGRISLGITVKSLIYFSINVLSLYF